jgi:hypothetical protein
MRNLIETFLRWWVPASLVLLVIMSDQVKAQARYEVREFTGIVKSIEPGWGLAYEVIQLDVDGKLEDFLFGQDYGKTIIAKIKINDKVTLKAKVNLLLRQKATNFKPNELAVARRSFGDVVTEIFVDGAWLPLPAISPTRQFLRPRVFLEKEVTTVYSLQYKDRRVIRALIFGNGLVGNVPMGTQKTDEIKKGDILSFIGYPFPVREGMAFPVEGVKEVYYLGLLNKTVGRLKSLLFKQNNVCIGIVMTITDGEEISLGFPSDYATRIRSFLLKKESVTFYYNPYKIEKLIEPPGVHAFVTGTDTLLIESIGFYGGTDVKHDHTQTEIVGAITAINRSAKGTVMSVMVDKNIYVEVDQNMAQQLGSMLRKGKAVVIKGDERIKKEGEIYQKDFRIITPNQITIGGKEFLLK